MEQVELIGGTEKYMAVCRECYKMEEDDEACHGNRISSPFPMIKSHHPKNIHASPEKLYCTNSSSSSSSNKENLADHAALWRRHQPRLAFFFCLFLIFYPPSSTSSFQPSTSGAGSGWTEFYFDLSDLFYIIFSFRMTDARPTPEIETWIMRGGKIFTFFFYQPISKYDANAFAWFFFFGRKIVCLWLVSCSRLSFYWNSKAQLTVRAQVTSVGYPFRLNFFLKEKWKGRHRFLNRFDGQSLDVFNTEY